MVAINWQDIFITPTFNWKKSIGSFFNSVPLILHQQHLLDFTSAKPSTTNGTLMHKQINTMTLWIQLVIVAIPLPRLSHMSSPVRAEHPYIKSTIKPSSTYFNCKSLPAASFEH